ncbi:MAG: PEP/pyruvate-binding domain-containing protein, partial [Prolixibacteraceae bacterium]|nr:PEP/pyruvate-binding domain-containing protein [Prolixibacteraceae bacterium]
MSIRIPATAVIGVVEFDHFIEYNNLYETIYSTNDYENIRSHFQDADLDVNLQRRVMSYLEVMDRPLAVRSSGLFEDSLLRPFSGVYATYLIPNNHRDINVRFEQLQTAIKLVYSSIFTESAQMYFDAINYKIEEEKMAVIIQEVVGHEFNGKFYPHISGVAHSYNYYPVAYMEPEDGFSVMAVGLGMYVAGGENAFRFCPRYPTLNSTSLHDQMRDSQRQFYAIDMTESCFDLVQGGENATVRRYRLKEAEADGTLELSASTYNMENDILTPGMPYPGPRIVDFGNILKYNAMPLADTLNLLLKLFREAMGAPVEMEFAIDLNPNDKGLPTFYLLQIKPMIKNEREVIINSEIAKDDASLLMYAERGMGNGSIHDIYDVVFVKPSEFNTLVTKDIALEISDYNKNFERSGKGYVLIGPGRWGSNDHFTGIPVYWAGISKARIIVEIGLHNLPLEGSLGSHFFHNVTSMNVGYFAIPHNSPNSFINMNILYEQETVNETRYIKHVRFDKPLTILMDGKSRQAMIRFEKQGS